MIQNSPQQAMSAITVPWQSCHICEGEIFKSPKDFINHLRIRHCRKEGGSYICTYGPNSICLKLPLEGVCEKDYETHVSRFHASPSITGHSGENSLTKSNSSSSDLSNNRVVASTDSQRKNSTPDTLHDNRKGRLQFYVSSNGLRSYIHLCNLSPGSFQLRS